MPVTSMVNSQVKPSMRRLKSRPRDGTHSMPMRRTPPWPTARILEGRQDGGAEGHRPCQEGGTVPGILAQEDGNEAPDERKGDDGQEGHATGHGWVVSFRVGSARETPKLGLYRPIWLT